MWLGIIGEPMAVDDDDDLLEITTRHGVVPSPVVGDGPVIPTLIIVSGTNAIGRMFRIEGENPLTIGRSPTATVVLGDEGISRIHARVEAQGNEVTLTDLGSSNGTFVNGVRIDGPRHLQDGDKIQFGGTTLMKFSYRDSADEVLQRNLYESATRDALTQAHNKKFFAEVLTQALAHSARYEAALSLVMFDLDRFKEVNDRFGHLAGDMVLRHFALLVHRQVRGEDLFCRWGGEEFVLVLRNCPAHYAIQVAERIRTDLEAAVFRGFPDVKATVSAGVVTYAKGRFSTPDDFIAAADARLYQAKQNGRNRIVAEPNGEKTEPFSTHE